MKLLLVGTGSIGRRHLRNLQALGCRDVIVYRSRAADSAALEREFGVRCVYDLDEALQEGVQVAIVANPTALHLPVALKCARYGCHLFIEKPLADRLEGVDDLLAAVRERKLRVLVGYNLRFHPLLKETHSLLARGAIGRVYSVRAWAGQYLPDWHPGEDYRQGYVARSELGGGVILTLSHELDYLYWLFGPVARVAAMAAQPSSLDMNTESVAEITLVFRSGVVGQVHLDCLQRIPSRGLEIIGSEGTIRADLHRGELRVYHPGDASPDVIVTAQADYNRTYFEEMAHFLDCIRGSGEPAIPLEAGIDVLKIAIAARYAALTGATQECL